MRAALFSIWWVVQDEPQQPSGRCGPPGFAPLGARCKTLSRFVEPAASFRNNLSNTKKGHPCGQPFLVFGGSCRIRTCDQLVKSLPANFQLVVFI